MVETLCVVHFPSQQPDATSRDVPLNLRRFGGSSLLEWIVRRVGDAQQVNQIVVVVGPREAASSVVKLLPQNVTVFTSQAADSLGQIADVVRKYPVDGVVRVSVDSPFVDPELIDRLLVTAEAHAECDYIGYSLGDGRPAIRSRIGVFADWYRAQAILDRRSTRSESRGSQRRNSIHLRTFRNVPPPIAARATRIGPPGSPPDGRYGRRLGSHSRDLRSVGPRKPRLETHRRIAGPPTSDAQTHGELES